MPAGDDLISLMSPALDAAQEADRGNRRAGVLGRLDVAATCHSIEAVHFALTAGEEVLPLTH